MAEPFGHMGSWSVSLGIDSDDISHISYYDYYLENLNYAFGTVSSWQIETVDSPGDVGK